jgi:hypothetical protein
MMQDLVVNPLISKIVFGTFSKIVGLLNYLFPGSTNGTYLKLLF